MGIQAADFGVLVPNSSSWTHDYHSSLPLFSFRSRAFLSYQSRSIWPWGPTQIFQSVSQSRACGIATSTLWKWMLLKQCSWLTELAQSVHRIIRHELQTRWLEICLLDFGQIGRAIRSSYTRRLQWLRDGFLHKEHEIIAYRTVGCRSSACFSLTLWTKPMWYWVIGFAAG